MGVTDETPRFWVFAHEHVVGPYDPQELTRLPVFDADLPLCPEELLGTAAELWHRAADTPVLFAAFPEDKRTPAGVEAPKVGPWPPDPEQSAVDLLGTAQDRMGIIDRSLEATQKRIEIRRAGYEKLKRDMAARAASAKLLEDKIQAMGTRMGGFLGVMEELDQTRAVLAMQNIRAAELEAHFERLEKLRGEYEGLKRELEIRLASAADVEDSARTTLQTRISSLEAQMKEAASQPGAPTPPRKKGRRRGGGPDPFSTVPTDPSEIGLPPPTTLDVPDFQ